MIVEIDPVRDITAERAETELRLVIVVVDGGVERGSNAPDPV
jgi:hypothetical protein